jgi:hypothetical protein
MLDHIPNLYLLILPSSVYLSTCTAIISLPLYLHCHHQSTSLLALPSSVYISTCTAIISLPLYLHCHHQSTSLLALPSSVYLINSQSNPLFNRPHCRSTSLSLSFLLYPSLLINRLCPISRSLSSRLEYQTLNLLSSLLSFNISPLHLISSRLSTYIICYSSYHLPLLFTPSYTPVFTIRTYPLPSLRPLSSLLFSSSLPFSHL